MTLSRGFTPALLLVLASLLSGSMSALAQNKQDLPSFGASGVVPVGQEYFMGRVWLMAYRARVPIVEDPIFQAYLEDLVFRLAEKSELTDHRLVVVAVKNPTINAFAVPGGVVGVHTGLVKEAENEAEFASVLTHELAHLSQRHFSRGKEEQQSATNAMLAGLLLGMVAVVGGQTDAAIGSVFGGMAASQAIQLRFSRGFEQEADRLGIQTLHRSGFDPAGAANMFTVMQRNSRHSGSRPPEFLMSHPLTESRIADARSRANQYPKAVYEDNLNFQLMRSRAQNSFMENDDEAVVYFDNKLASKGRNAEAHQYGLVLALTRKREYAKAQEYLQPLRKYSPDNLTYLLAEADIYIESGEFDQALSLLGRSWMLHPGNYPLTMAVVKAHLRAGRYSEAEKILTPVSKQRGSDPFVWYVLAEIQGLSGNIYQLHQSRAQYFYLKGEMLAARAQLGYALKLASDDVARERLRQEQQLVLQAAKALGQL